MRIVEDALHLFVHLLRGVVGHLPALDQFAAQEDLLVAVSHRHQADAVGHPEPGDHAPRHRRGALDVVAGPGGDLLRAELQFLGHAAAEEHRQLAVEPVQGVGVAVLLR